MKILKPAKRNCGSNVKPGLEIGDHLSYVAIIHFVLTTMILNVVIHMMPDFSIF